MKIIVLIALFVALQFSLIIHIGSLTGYLSKKTQYYFKLFMVTAVSNSLTGISLAVFVMVNRDALKGINLDAVLLFESGFVFLFLVLVKLRVTYLIIKRLRDPSNYHYSFFGKKIYDKSVVTMKDLAAYFLTMPFTVITGAYFLAKIFHR